MSFARKPKSMPIEWGIPSASDPPPPPPPPVLGPTTAPDAGDESNTSRPRHFDEDGRLYGVAGYIPPLAGNKKAIKQARRVEVEHRRRLMETRKAQIAALRDQQREAGYLPKAGEAGPAAARTHRRLRITPHRATSEMLAGAYLFLAEEGLGSEGALIGQDAWSGTAFCYDPWELYRRGVLTNPNMFLAGQIGRGKSTLAKALATRYIAFGRRVYVPGDPKGEWSIVTQAAGGQVIELGIGRPARLNPLDEGPRPAALAEQSWQAQLTQRRMSLLAALAQSTLGRPLQPTERTALDAALDLVCRASSAPILPMVVDHLHSPASGYAGSSIEQLTTDGREVAHALGRLVRGDLAGLFDGPSTVAFDPTLPMLSLDLSHISGSDQLLGLVMACTSAWMEASLADPSGGQRLVVYDEAWRLLAHPSLLARMQAHWKLSRAWGLANLMIVHRLSDLDAVGDAGSETRGLAQGLLGDTATRILYNEPHDEAVAAGKILGLTTTQVRQLPDLAQGEGLWKVNQRAFVVRHICTPDELVLFDTNARMLTNPRRFEGHVS
jgi:hypothetical protein